MKLSLERFREIYAEQKPYFELLDSVAFQKIVAYETALHTATRSVFDVQAIRL